MEYICVCGVIHFDPREVKEHMLICDAWHKANVRPVNLANQVRMDNRMGYFDDLDEWAHDWRMEQLDEQQEEAWLTDDS